MVTKESNLALTVKEAIQCYGLSKMTVANEMEKGGS